MEELREEIRKRIDAESRESIPICGFRVYLLSMESLTITTILLGISGSISFHRFISYLRYSEMIHYYNDI